MSRGLGWLYASPEKTGFIGIGGVGDGGGGGGGRYAGGGRCPPS